MVARRLKRVLALGVAAVAVTWASCSSGRTQTVRADSSASRIAPVFVQMPSADSIKPLLSRGNYVFEAVLQSVGAVADSILPANEQTAVARVTRVFACPREVGNFSKELVTLSELGPHAPIGARSWYFGSGWSIGEHVAVRVLRRVDSLDDKASLKFIDTLRAAVSLSYTESVRAAAQASDSIVIGTLGTIQNVMIDLAPPHTEHAERWVRLNVTLDSIRAFRDTSSDTSVKKFVPGWVPAKAATRNAGILIPYDVAYNAVGRTQMVVGVRRLLFFERITRRPNLHVLDGSAAGFIPNADGIRPLSDAARLGRTLAMPTFTLAPVQECPQ